jgi:hypothetical protein
MEGLVGLFIIGGAVWLICAYMAYVTAGKKRRRPITWGLLGILFGPLAYAAVFMMPPGNMPTHHAEEAAAAPHDHGSGSHDHPAGTSGHEGHDPSHGQTQAQADNYEVPNKHKH